MLEQIIFLKQLEAKLEILEARQLEQWHAIKVMRDELAKEMTRITDSIQLVSEEDEVDLELTQTPNKEISSANEELNESPENTSKLSPVLETASPLPIAVPNEESEVSAPIIEEIPALAPTSTVSAPPIENAIVEAVSEISNVSAPKEPQQPLTANSSSATTTTNSINDQYNNKPSNLGEQLTLKPINDLKSAIGTNDRFLFIAQLFGGDAAKFNQAIVNLNHCANLEAALQHLHNNYKRAEWEQNHITLEQLEIYLRRRYANS